MGTKTKYAPQMTYRKAEVVPRRADLKLPPFAISEPRKAAQAVSALISDYAYEHFIVLYFDVRNKVIGYDVSTEMSPVGVAVVPQSVVRNAVLMTAPAIMTAHNHPSGNPTPSEQDQELWRLLRKQADFMHIVVLDNLVVGDGEYYSELENGVGAFKTNPSGRAVYPTNHQPQVVHLNPRLEKCDECRRMIDPHDPWKGHEDWCREGSSHQEGDLDDDVRRPQTRTAPSYRRR